MKWLDRIWTLATLATFAWFVTAAAFCVYDTVSDATPVTADELNRYVVRLIVPMCVLYGLFGFEHLAMKATHRQLDERYAHALKLIEAGSRLLGDAPVDSSTPPRQSAEWKDRLQDYRAEVNWFCTQGGHHRQRYVTVGDDGEENEERAE